ncbi:hypothetical protein MASR1M32_12260 [Rhodobacter sp.]
MTPIHLILIPVRMDDLLTLSAEGATLTCTGETVDLASYSPDLPCRWIVGQPELREDGWHVSVILPHGAEAPEETRFPAPITITSGGLLTLPPYESGVSAHILHQETF